MKDTVSVSKKLPFKVSARTAKLIGLENFSTEEGAIIELVKNTYDADSKNCLLIFDLKYHSNEGDIEPSINKEFSKIYIIDNGIGMTEKIISNQWMTIGTDDKLYDPRSDKGRVKTGAKGIGRFALNRLGLLTELSTVSIEEGKGVEWLVDWRDFDRKGASVSDVEAILIQNESLNLKNVLLDRFREYERIGSLINDISFDSGTVIEITELNDDWNLSQLTRLFENLEMLLPPKEQSDFRIDMFSLSNISDFGKVKTAFYDDFDYKVEASYDENNDKILNLDISRKELDIEALEKRYFEVFDYESMKVSPYTLSDFKKDKIKISKPLSSIMSKDVSQDLLDQIGKFDFTFYFLKNTISDDKNDGNIKKYPYRSFNSANRKAWLKKFGGVKIFRDEFRIRPYGEKGEDWLRLGERQSQSPGGAGQRLGGYRIRPNQIAGTVNISRINNISFQDKSGREGIIENDVFELFKNVIKDIISLFEKDRNTIMYYLSELHKDKNKEEELRRKAQEEADNIKKEEEEKEEATNNQQDNGSSDGKSASAYTDREKVLADGVQILTKENEEKDDEIRLLRSLASVGLIISSFAHEVKSLRSRLIPRTEHLINELSKYLNEEELAKDKELDKDDNPFYMIKLMSEEDTKLKHWLDYSLNTLKRDKRERVGLNFSDYFERFKSTWNKALQQRNINLIIEGEDNCKIQAFEVDMDSIFNNLLSNAINAVKGIKGREKTITINWKKVQDDIEISFFDNGKGLDEKYKEDPDEIFVLNESSREDIRGNKIGTGLGLYIVKSIIEEYNQSTINIIGVEQGLSLKITFKTRK
ncbi:sensor histidine kinase [Chryseobacterium sp. Marseille-Q3244]|uniref:sensor histidine kinase n=1 Tax=Chryseobacterium sp. Marseille-Q3244 TaxID=2758092 RepID=UPI00202416E3|nr:sensor histidine kinase [Chryseobacterium sp. Marseille-Q3244]